MSQALSDVKYQKILLMDVTICNKEHYIHNVSQLMIVEFVFFRRRSRRKRFSANDIELVNKLLLFKHKNYIKAWITRHFFNTANTNGCDDNSNNNYYGYFIWWLIVEGVDEIIISTCYRIFSQCHHSQLSRFE